MTRPIPTCHQTLHAAYRDGDAAERPFGTSQPVTLGSPCIGSRCSAFWPEKTRSAGSMGVATLKPTGRGGCRLFGAATVHEMDLWPDPAAPADPS